MTDPDLSECKTESNFVNQCLKSALNEIQVKLLNHILDGFEGKLTSCKWAAIAKCSPDIALPDITQLLEIGVLQRSPGAGRSAGYLLVDGDIDR